MKRCLCVLLVEDDPALGPMMRYALDSLGHDSVLATSADSTYKCLSHANHRFEVVLLDLQLHDERSEPVIEKLRAGGYALPPIIIFSALIEDDLRRAMRVTGAKAFVQKPASVRDLDEAIARVVA